MHFHFSFYSSLLLIFFTHGILFSALLLKKSYEPSQRPSRWLAGFTFVCTLNILPWMLGHAGWYSLQPYRNILFYFPFQNFFLLGPLIFFYTKALLNPGSHFSKKDWLHFAPALLYIIYTAVMFIADGIVLQKAFFYADGHDRDLDTWYRLAGIASLSFYLLCSLRYYAVYKKVATQFVSFADDVLFRWMKRYLLALLVMQVLDVVFLCLYPDWGSFTSKWWYYFAFSVLFYYVAFVAYTHPVKPLFTFRLFYEHQFGLLLTQPVKSVAVKPVLLLGNAIEETIATVIEEESTVPNNDLDLEPWRARILKALIEDDVYKVPELTLTSLAKQVGTNASVLSKVINRGFGLSFNDFINGYRVEAVKKALENGEHTRQTLLGLSMDCGFNSKTTFNRVFKKHTGLSPKAYIQLIEETEKGKQLVSEEFDVPNHDLGRPSAGSTKPLVQNTIA